jgi:hypothetical protein
MSSIHCEHCGEPEVDRAHPAWVIAFAYNGARFRGNVGTCGLWTNAAFLVFAASHSCLL